MIHFTYQNMWLLWYLLPVLAAFVFWFAAWRRGIALQRFAEAKLLPLLNTSISKTARVWKAIILVLAILTIIFAGQRPAWKPIPKKVSQSGRDVVFVLDVSKSMLANDLAPNRLERSKLAIRDCLSRLQGDRVGLIVFAGSAVVKCPLTLDYGFFRLMLEDVGPYTVGRGGTMIGDAVRKATDEVFDGQEKDFKDIILITDGEDHESLPVQAAAVAGEKGIRIIAIGLGDENQGRRIPIEDEQGRVTFLKNKQGQEVFSKLDADVLRQMANNTPNGRYLNVSTGTIDLGDVYTKLVAQAAKKKLETKTIKRYEERFQIFIGIGIVLLIVEMLISERRRGSV